MTRATFPDSAEAAALLLRDADDWWDGELPSADDAVRAWTAPTMRDAVRHLRLGRVGDYMLHRWSDPVFVAALGLLRLGWPGKCRVVDVGCGTGPVLRELALRGVEQLIGIDVVLTKLWLARQYVLPSSAWDVRLCCLNAGQSWRALHEDEGPRSIVCVDALYFLPDPAEAATAMIAAAGPAGAVLVGGVPNGALQRRGGGHRITPDELASMLPGAELYDEVDLLAYAIDGVEPTSRTPAELTASITISALWTGPEADRQVGPDLGAAVPGRRLTVNPLYGDDGALRWPSERYRADYADRSPYLPTKLPSVHDLTARPEVWARRRVLLDLPERW